MPETLVGSSALLACHLFDISFLHSGQIIIMTSHVAVLFRLLSEGNKGFPLLRGA